MKTSEELHALHKELWGWLAETGSDTKREWPGWNEKDFLLSEIRVAYDNGCFACQEAFNRIPDGDDEDVRCNYCPVAWTQGRCFCQTEGSPFEEWQSAAYEYSGTKIKQRLKKFAAQIRDLPWSPRPEVKP